MAKLQKLSVKGGREVSHVRNMGSHEHVKCNEEDLGGLKSRHFDGCKQSIVVCYFFVSIPSEPFRFMVHDQLRTCHRHRHGNRYWRL